MKNIGKRLKFIAVLLLTVILTLGTMLPAAAATAEGETTATVGDLISRLWNNRYMEKIKELDLFKSTCPKMIQCATEIVAEMLSQ